MILVQQVQPAQVEQLVQKATSALKDRRGPLVRKEKSESKEQKVPLVQLVRKDQKVQLEAKDKKEKQVPVDPLGHQVK